MNIDRHPLLRQCYELCQQIERCGANPSITRATILCNELSTALDRYIPTTPTPLAGEGGEAVAWEYRDFYEGEGWGPWRHCNKVEADMIRGKSTRQVRDLYAAPQPTLAPSQGTAVTDGNKHGTFSFNAALHPDTANLVAAFAGALAAKLYAAQLKYGYSDGWASNDWMDECRSKLVEHVAKGDPRDVAAYCAFLWHHGESTSALSSPAARDEKASEPLAILERLENVMRTSQMSDEDRDDAQSVLTELHASLRTHQNVAAAVCRHEPTPDGECIECERDAKFPGYWKRTACINAIKALTHEFRVDISGHEAVAKILDALLALPVATPASILAAEDGGGAVAPDIRAAWTDELIAAFLSVALRHAEYKRGCSPTFDEIRDGFVAMQILPTQNPPSQAGVREVSDEMVKLAMKAYDKDATKFDEPLSGGIPMRAALEAVLLTQGDSHGQ